MRSNRWSGSRREMLCVVGLSLGRMTRSAFDQSTNSALSCVSQTVRSAASDLNCGTTLGFLFIVDPFLPAHVARGNDAYLPAVHAQDEGDMAYALKVANSVGAAPSWERACSRIPSAPSWERACSRIP